MLKNGGVDGVGLGLQWIVKPQWTATRAGGTCYDTVSSDRFVSKVKQVSKQSIAYTTGTYMPYRITGSHGVTCHPAEVGSKAGIWFSDSGVMQG